MYKKILVPLDGSELSERAISHVKTVAFGCHNPEVILFRVVEFTEEVYKEIYKEMGKIGEGWQEEARKEAEAETVAYLSMIADAMKQEGVIVQTDVISGKPAEEISNYAHKNEVDLIVMSTIGRSGASRWVFGSVADRVIRHVKVPVLIVR
ncbi:universal stress protein [Thermodesulfovibrionales bacterium]|nr:universal stress protein [Thermodesulfovibrionales bacterium]